MNFVTVPDRLPLLPGVGVLPVDEDVKRVLQLALPGQDNLFQVRVLPHEVLEALADGLSLHRYARLVVGVPGEDGRNLNFDTHMRLPSCMSQAISWSIQAR